VLYLLRVHNLAVLIPFCCIYTISTAIDFHVAYVGLFRGYEMWLEILTRLPKGFNRDIET